MNIRRGLFRLWVLFSALWALACVSIAAVDGHWLESESSIRNRQSQRRKIGGRGTSKCVARGRGGLRPEGCRLQVGAGRMHPPGTMVQRSDPTENAANRRFCEIDPRRGFASPNYVRLGRLALLAAGWVQTRRGLVDGGPGLEAPVRRSDPAARRARARDPAGCLDTYITKLPKAEHDAPEWQAVTEALILVAERGGPTMLARIGVLRVLNRHRNQVV